MSVDQLSSTALTKDQAYALVDAVSERDDLALTASAHPSMVPAVEGSRSSMRSSILPPSRR